jgi:hypothetical protein
MLFAWNELNSVQNLELNKIPYFYTASAVSSIFGSEVTVKALFVIVVSLIPFIMFISLYILYHEKTTSTVKLAAICCIPSLFYLLNPVVVDRISNHIFMVFGMAFNPIIVVQFLRVLERGARFLDLIIVAFLITIANIVSTHNIFYLLPILLLCFLFYFFHPKVNDRRSAAKATGIIIGLYLLLNGYWMFPIVYSQLKSEIGPSYSTSIEGIAKLSTRNSPNNVLALIGGGGWDPVLQFPDSAKILGIFLSYVVPLFSLIAVAFFTRVRLVLFSAVLFIILYVLALGTNSPIPVYHWLLNSPITSHIVWLFRDPSRFLLYIALVYSILLAFIIHRVVDSQYSTKLRATITLSVLLAIIVSPASFTFINNAGNRLISSHVPVEYIQIYNFLNTDTDEFHVLWLPFKEYYRYDWNRVQQDVAGNFYHESSPKPSIGLETESNHIVSEYWKYIYDKIIINYGSNELGKILNLLGVKYLVVHDDLMEEQEKETSTLLRILSVQKDIELEKHTGPYYLYKNSRYVSNNHVFISNTAESMVEYLKHLQLLPSNSTHNVDIHNPSEWNTSNLNSLSEIKVNNTSLLLWKSKQVNSTLNGSEISFKLPNTNTRYFDRLNLLIYPFANNTANNLTIMAYSNASKITLNVQDLSLGQWNKEVFDLVPETLTTSNLSDAPNFLNITSIGLKVFDIGYNISDNTFLLKNISFVHGPDYMDNNQYSSDITFDNLREPKSKENIISNFSKIDPTKYELDVNASRPYVLGFVEPYSPFWVAEVKEGHIHSQFNSFPIFAGLNGFSIDRLGQYKIEIKYKPQEWLQIGSLVSISTLIGLIAYGIILACPKIKILVKTIVGTNKREI